MYQSIINAVPQELVLQKDIYISQHEMIGDSLVYVKVGVTVSDDLLNVKAPMDIRDTEDHSAIVMHVEKGYTQRSMKIFRSCTNG